MHTYALDYGFASQRAIALVCCASASILVCLLCINTTICMLARAYKEHNVYALLFVLTYTVYCCSASMP
jgi:hypothetical protein